jgi:hypothetical protein
MVQEVWVCWSDLLLFIHVILTVCNSNNTICSVRKASNVPIPVSSVHQEEGQSNW